MSEIKSDEIAEMERLWREMEMPERVEFHYVKSNYFRVLAVEGGVGSSTPQGRITIGLYNERKAIPKLTALIRNAQGSLGDEEVVEGKEGMVRELEAELNMSPEVAIQIGSWLIRQGRAAKRGLELRAEFEAHIQAQQEVQEAAEDHHRDLTE